MFLDLKDAELQHAMRAGLNGDEMAYRSFLVQATFTLRAIARAENVSHSHAESLVQQMLAAVHAKRHSWNQNEPIKPWLLAIARSRLSKGRSADFSAAAH